MDKLSSILNNDIVNNVIRLFLILYAGYIFELDTTYLHKWINNRIFSILFLTIIMYALTKNLLFSLILTSLFYLFFTFLTKLETKNEEKRVIEDATQYLNSLSQNQQPIVPQNTIKKNVYFSDNIQIAPTNIPIIQPINDYDTNSVRLKNFDRIHQLSQLQTDTDFSIPGTKFFDDKSQSHILPYSGQEFNQI